MSTYLKVKSAFTKAGRGLGRLRRGLERLWRGGIFLVGIMATIWLLLFFVLALVDLSLNRSFDAFQQKTIWLAAGQRLDVRWPSEVLGGKEYKITFILSQDEPMPLPKIALELPDALFTCEGEKQVGRVFPEKAQGLKETAGVCMRSAGALRWLDTEEKIVILADEEVVANDLSVTIEGKLRQWSAAQTRRSVWGVIVGAIVSLFVGLFQYWTREQEWKERREEERKKRERITTTFEYLRDRMRERRFEGLRQRLPDEKEILEMGLINSLDVAAAQQILDWAEDKLEAKKPPPGWETEAAQALIYLGERGNYKNRGAFLQILRSFPLDQVEDSTRNELEMLQEDPPSLWPPRMSNMPGGGRSNVSREEEVDLFPACTAQGEEHRLFGEDAAFFWRHPLIGDIRSWSRTGVVFGESGSGKTALALALGRYVWTVSDDETPPPFTVYLPRFPKDWQEIQEAMALELLAFIEWLPSHLVALDTKGKHVLAQVLVNGLRREGVLGALKAQRIERESRAIQAHVRFLEEMVETIEPSASMPERAWCKNFFGVLQRFEFSPSMWLVIDTDGSDCTVDFYKEVIWKRQAWWSDLCRLRSVVFCSSAMETEPWPAGVERAVLQWSREQLEEMTKHRWSELRNLQYRAVDMAAVDWKRLWSKARGNPRRLACLWKKEMINRNMSDRKPTDAE